MLKLAGAVETLFKPHAIARLKASLQGRADLRRFMNSNPNSSPAKFALKTIYVKSEKDIPGNKERFEKHETLFKQAKSRKAAAEANLKAAVNLKNTNVVPGGEPEDPAFARETEKLDTNSGSYCQDYVNIVRKYETKYENLISRNEAAFQKLTSARSKVSIALSLAEQKAKIIKKYIAKTEDYRKRHGVFPAVSGHNKWQTLYRLIAANPETLTVMSWYAPKTTAWREFLDELRSKYVKTA